MNSTWYILSMQQALTVIIYCSSFYHKNIKLSGSPIPNLSQKSISNNLPIHCISQTVCRFLVISENVYKSEEWSTYTILKGQEKYLYHWKSFLIFSLEKLFPQTIMWYTFLYCPVSTWFAFKSLQSSALKVI